MNISIERESRSRPRFENTMSKNNIELNGLLALISEENINWKRHDSVINTEAKIYLGALQI